MTLLAFPTTKHKRTNKQSCTRAHTHTKTKMLKIYLYLHTQASKIKTNDSKFWFICGGSFSIRHGCDVCVRALSLLLVVVVARERDAPGQARPNQTAAAALVRSRLGMRVQVEKSSLINSLFPLGTHDRGSARVQKCQQSSSRLSPMTRAECSRLGPTDRER